MKKNLRVIAECLAVCLLLAGCAGYPAGTEADARQAGQPSPVHMVGLIVQLLDDLRVEHTHKVRKRGIVVGNDGEDGCLPLPDLAYVHIVVGGDGADLVHVEGRQPNGQRDVDALGGLA